MLIDAQLYLLSLFVQVDQKKSLQRGVRTKDRGVATGHLDFSYEELYSRLVFLSDKTRFQRGLTFPEKVFLAKYYASYKNERDGRTIRYTESYTPDDQGFHTKPLPATFLDPPVDYNIAEYVDTSLCVVSRFPEKVFRAKYHTSYKNESNGRTIRYSESYTPDDQGY